MAPKEEDKRAKALLPSNGTAAEKRVNMVERIAPMNLKDVLLNVLHNYFYLSLSLSSTNCWCRSSIARRRSPSARPAA